MYSNDWIMNNEFFGQYANEEVLDSLTRVIARKYILEYVEYLIKKDVPFTFAVVDIDNFKSINDKYGHLFGDVILKDISSALLEYVGEDGVVGRFGGDEFLVVYLKDTSYDGLKDFLKGLYDKTVFRRIFESEKGNLFLTGTAGCATYPYDAKTEKELFEKADKALYRGKIKGRNCYIIYVHEKHKDVDIASLKKITTDKFIDDITDFFLANQDFDMKLINTMRYIRKTLGYGSFFIYPNMTIRFDEYQDLIKVDESESIILEKMFEGVKLKEFIKLHEIHERSLELYTEFKKKKILSFLIRKIEHDGVVYGYFGIFEDRITRIWQPEDRTSITFVGKLILIDHVK